MTDLVQIAIAFQRETEVGTYSDCLYFAVNDYFDENGGRLIPDEYIEEVIDERVTAWVNAVLNASQYDGPGLEGVE